MVRRDRGRSGFSSGDSFPPEFENTYQMKVGDLSEIIEDDGLFISSSSLKKTKKYPKQKKL